MFGNIFIKDFILFSLKISLDIRSHSLSNLFSFKFDKFLKLFLSFDFENRSTEINFLVNKMPTFELSNYKKIIKYLLLKSP